MVGDVDVFGGVEVCGVDGDTAMVVPVEVKVFNGETRVRVSG